MFLACHEGVPGFGLDALQTTVSVVVSGWDRGRFWCVSLQPGFRVRVRVRVRVVVVVAVGR